MFSPANFGHAKWVLHGAFHQKSDFLKQQNCMLSAAGSDLSHASDNVERSMTQQTFFLCCQTHAHNSKKTQHEQNFLNNVTLCLCTSLVVAFMSSIQMKSFVLG